MTPIEDQRLYSISNPIAGPRSRIGNAFRVYSLKIAQRTTQYVCLLDLRQTPFLSQTKRTRSEVAGIASHRQITVSFGYKSGIAIFVVPHSCHKHSHHEDNHPSIPSSRGRSHSLLLRREDRCCRYRSHYRCRPEGCDCHRCSQRVRQILSPWPQVLWWSSLQTIRLRWRQLLQQEALLPPSSLWLLQEAVLWWLQGRLLQEIWRPLIPENVRRILE